MSFPTAKIILPDVSPNVNSFSNSCNSSAMRSFRQKKRWKLAFIRIFCLKLHRRTPDASSAVKWARCNAELLQNSLSSDYHPDIRYKTCRSIINQYRYPAYLQCFRHIFIFMSNKMKISDYMNILYRHYNQTSSTASFSIIRFWKYCDSSAMYYCIFIASVFVLQKIRFSLIPFVLRTAHTDSTLYFRFLCWRVLSSNAF